MTGMGYPYAHADTLLDEIEAGRSVECAWYQGTGITANGFAEPRRAGALLKRTGFSVVADLFMSPAAEELADVFLPVCTCLERRGIRNWWYQLAAFDRVIEPLGESRSDMEIVLRAGKLMAPEHFPWSDVTGWFDHVLEPSGYSWSELEAVGWLMPGTEYRKGFSTPRKDRAPAGDNGQGRPPSRSMVFTPSLGSGSPGLPPETHHRGQDPGVFPRRAQERG